MRLELGLETVDRPDAVFRGGGHARGGRDMPHLLGVEPCEDGLADPGGVHMCTASHLGEHPHLAFGCDLIDVDDHVSVHRRHVRRLPELGDELAQIGAGDGAELGAGDIAEADQPGSERIAAIGQLSDHTEVDECVEQTVDRRQGQIDVRGDMAQRCRARGVRDALKQSECTFDGLYAALGLADRRGVLAAHRGSLICGESRQ
jgi:hypothetical protein